MTLVNIETGELVGAITVEDVDASIARVRMHAESIWDEWAWQVQNRAWAVKGYASWDAMREAEYFSISNVRAPRANTPELVARFRQAGLTQRETANTLGVNERTVQRNDATAGSRGPAKNTANVGFPDQPDVVDAEIVDEEAPAPKRDRVWELDPSKEVTLINDIRLYLRALASAPEVGRLTPAGKQHIIDALQDTISQLERKK